MKTAQLTKACAYCGKSFKGNNKAKYCSPSCRVLACRARKDPSGQLRGVGQKENKLQEEAKKIFAEEIPRHEDLAAVKAKIMPVGAPLSQPSGLKELVVVAGIALGLSMLFDTKRK